MKILLTGFEPFDKSPINPSEQIVCSLAAESVPGVQLETAVLPVDLTVVAHHEIQVAVSVNVP